MPRSIVKDKTPRIILITKYGQKKERKKEKTELKKYIYLKYVTSWYSDVIYLNGIQFKMSMLVLGKTTIMNSVRTIME